MRRLTLLTIAALLPGMAVAQTFPKTPPAPMPLRAAQFPPFREAVLPNGLRLLVVENRKQPIIAVSLSFDAGGIRDPKAKEGLASMTASLLNKGAGARDADQVSAAIEGVGGSFSAVAGDDFLQLFANALSRDAALAFELMADAAIRPTFAAKEVELLRTQRLSALQLERSQPARVADRLFAQAVYGDHPYGRSPDEASVKAITRDDIAGFHKAWLRPQGALLVVAGDLSLDAAKALAMKAFAGWSGAPAAVAGAPLPARTKGELVLVHRPGSVQSNVIIGNTTWSPADPRGYAATVINEVLGGGSEGRFFRILREQKGWTYGSYSSLATRKGGGTFEATGEFRTEVTDSAVKVMLEQIRELRAKPVAAGEFDARKGSLTGRFPLQVETAEQVANRVASARLLGRPADYVQTYRARLAAVTPAQAQAAATALMRPDAGVILVVGDGAKLYDRLQGLAPVMRLVDVDGKPLAPGDLTPKASTLAIAWDKLQARADSFSVLLQGNPFGYQTSTLEAVADGWRLTEHTVLGPIINQTTVATFTKAGVMQAVKQTGKVQGQDAFVDVTYAAGRATGKAKTPGPQGMQEVTINAEVPAGALDDNLVQSLLPLMPLAAGAKLPVSVFQSGRGASATWTLSVEGEEEVKVPTGTFTALKVAVQGSEQPATYFVRKDAPHELLKIAIQGAPIEIVRAR